MADQLRHFMHMISNPRARDGVRRTFESFLFEALTFRSIEFADGYGIKDSAGSIVWREGAAVPTAATSGYAVGAVFILNGATLGQCPRWINHGTTSSCLFYPDGPVLGYGFKHAGILDATNGSTTDSVLADLAEENDIPLVGFFASNDNDQSQAYVTAGKSFLQLKNSADPLTAHDYQWALMRNKCTPEWDIFAAGTHTTTGGAAAEAITVTGAQAGDKAIVCYSATDDNDVIRQAVVTANTLTVTCDNDPSTTHGVHYVVLRPRGSFKPSHYVAYAGTHTTVGGDATETKTVTGALATDVLITSWGTSDDTDTIKKAVLTANTITWTLSQDPLTAHKLNYAILRAY